MKIIHVIFGTRPELIKLLPVIIELKRKKNIKTIIINTNQHDQLLDKSLIKIVKPINLKIKKNKLLDKIFIEIISNLNLKIKKSNGIIVQGDTASTLGGSIVGFLKKIKVFHVEAGLRTYNRQQPYPEEFNRVLTSHISDLHFAPTKLNKNNLIKENIRKNNIIVTGNTVIDSVNYISSRNIKNDEKLKLFFKKNYKFDVDNKFVLFTCHRRELSKVNLDNIVQAINDYSIDYFNQIVLPIHANPKIKNYFLKCFKLNRFVKIIPNQNYENFIFLLKKCNFVVTDSGGVQEEASYLNKKILVIRNTTERREILKSGIVKLVGYDRQKIFDSMKYFNDKKVNKSKFKNTYGTGIASKLIVNSILKNIHG